MIHPDDDNGDVLRRMEAHGDDLTKSRDIDFMVVFPSEDAARQFSEQIGAQGYATSAKFAQAKVDFPWDVRVINRMKPTHQAITEFENVLEELAATFGGFNDGWGSLAQSIVN
jgi:hypothetical protein